jgi:hypothetical protein
MKSSSVMTEKEASRYIGMSMSYLQHDRCYGVTGNKIPGPAFIRLGRSIRYLKPDLDGWLLENRVKRDGC